MKKVAIIFVLVFTFASSSSFAFGWKTLKNDHFTIFYKSEYENQAWNYLKVLEYYRPGVEKLTGNSAYHLPIVIEAWMSTNIDLLYKSVRKEKDKKAESYDPVNNLNQLHDAYPKSCIYLSMLSFQQQWNSILPRIQGY